MKSIYYNSAVAIRCGKNGIIKAVLLNYVYNYHKINIRKGAGHPAQISLAEFQEQYKMKDEKGLWGRSFIHKILKDLEEDRHLNNNPENGRAVYSVSPEIAGLLNAKDAVVVSFDLELALQHTIYVAIVYRYVIHVIDKSKNGIAYNLNVKEMSEINRISPAQIYRVIKFLLEKKILQPPKQKWKQRSKGLSLTKC